MEISLVSWVLFLGTPQWNTVCRGELAIHCVPPAWRGGKGKMCSKGVQFEEKLDLWTCSERPTIEYRAGKKCLCLQEVQGAFIHSHTQECTGKASSTVYVCNIIFSNNQIWGLNYVFPIVFQG